MPFNQKLKALDTLLNHLWLQLTLGYVSMDLIDLTTAACMYCFFLSSFTDVYVGCPGRTDDVRVLTTSPLYKLAEEQDGYLFPREVNYFIYTAIIPVVFTHYTQTRQYKCIF